MSLISDTDFLIHSLRLSYLRDVDDPYGARIINWDPSYTSNPYIVSASLADAERWPELAMPSSPHLSEDEGERPSGFPGARLKHTQTIMGGRTGGLGLRVNAKRASMSKRMAATPHPDEVQNFISVNAPVQEGLSTAAPVSLADHADVKWDKSDDPDKGTSSPQPNVQIQEPTMVVEAPVTKTVQFIPTFKGAAEMEARRRIRMAARRGPGDAPPVLAIDSSSSSSSSEEAVAAIDDSSDSDFGDVADDDSMDDGDEFDPDFVNTRTSGISGSSLSDIALELIPSTSHSSAPSSSQRPRLSPVSEVPPPAKRSRTGEKYYPPRKLNGATVPDRNTAQTGPPSSSLPVPTSNSFSSSSSPEMAFPRKKVLPIKPQHSALTALLLASSNSFNPFAETYAAISGRGQPQSTNVLVYFPHAQKPSGKGMDLNVRKDSTIEEVIGFALFTYWEEGWLPKLDEGLSGEDDPQWAIKLSAVGWIMRIAEDDGEVDDDFPPPDRMGKVIKFNADAYAVLEATPNQINQNQILETKIQRSSSRSASSKKLVEKSGLSQLAIPALGTIPGSGSAIIGSTLGSVPLSTSLGPSSSQGPQIFLRIRVADTVDAVHVSTMINVFAGMYMQEALEMVCRKRRFNPKDYALLLGDMSILIPLDRTVASLQGKRDLVLIKKSMLQQIGPDALKATGKTTDPNASIFKRMSDTPEVKMSSALDYTAAYKKYTIYRKMPMLVARQERTLAIDGVYIHIMPSNKAKAVFDSGKTWSYHIKSIVDCQQPTKSSATFRLVLNRASANKRYDYEAESAKSASEIVQTVRNLKAALERSGTVKTSRRSRHVG